MCDEHDAVASDEELERTEEPLAGLEDEPGEPTPSDALTDGDAPISSEDDPAELLDEEPDLVEDGYLVETHGGGLLESVPGYNVAVAMTEGFESAFVEIDETLEALPIAHETEFEEPETVCGRDDRVRLRETTRIPWRVICQLVAYRKDGSRVRGTGWFIGPRTVMTAGHVVYSHAAGGWPERVEVIPGIDGASRPFGSAIARSYRSVRGWISRRNPEFDYGAVILPDNRLGNLVGWFGFAALGDRSLRNLLVNNAGYAGDKPFGTLWYNAGRIGHATERRLYYMIDTYGGQSGSPVWRTLANGQRHVVGIHAYGGCPNKATRITRGVYANMMKWKTLGS